MTPIFVYGALTGFILRRVPQVMCFAAIGIPATAHRVLPALKCIMVSVLVLLLVAPHFEITLPFVQMARNELLQALLGMGFGFSLRGTIHQLEARSATGALPGITPQGNVRDALYSFIVPGLILTASLLLSQRLTKLDAKLVTLEFAHIMQPEQKQLLIDLNDPDFKLQLSLLKPDEFTAGLADDLDRCSKLYNGRDKHILQSSEVFFEKMVRPLILIVEKLISSQRQDPEVIRSYLRPLVLEYRRLIVVTTADERAFLQAYNETMERLIEADFDSSSTQLTNKASYSWPSAAPITTLRVSPYSYITLAYLSWFNGDAEGALKCIDIGRSLRGDNPCVSGENLSLNMLYQTISYYTGRDASTMIASFDEISKTIDEMMASAQRVNASSIFNELSMLQLRARSNVAYFLAQEGKSAIVAHELAEAAFKKLPTNPYVVDNYGYVMMATAARKSPPDFDTILKARDLFKEAFYLNKSVTNPLKHKANHIVITHHISQAERLLMQKGGT